MTGEITVNVILAFGYFATFACPFLGQDTGAYVWLNHHIMQ